MTKNSSILDKFVVLLLSAQHQPFQKVFVLMFQSVCGLVRDHCDVGLSRGRGPAGEERQVRRPDGKDLQDLSCAGNHCENLFGQLLARLP